MYQVIIETEEGETVSFECGPSEDVISAGLRQSVILLSSCRAGGCATCKGECTDGDYELVDAKVQALPPDEEENGMVLLCRTYPRSDLHILVPYTHDRISFEAIQTNWIGEIKIYDKVSSNVVRLVVQVLTADGSAPIALNFKPGQFIDIEIPGTHTKRSYSMASVSGDCLLEFFIRILPDGAFSKFLTNEAKIGMRINMRGPAGSFGLHENGMRPRYFVGGGTGLSPVLSMIRQMKKEGDNRPAKLFFGVNRCDELFYLDELKSLRDGMSNLDVLVAVVEGAERKDVAHGTVIDLLREELLIRAADPDIYLCGPPGMIDAAFAAAAAAGVPREQVYQEKFLASG
ncbi:aromatic/alkene monooxygenase hydroxylase FAD-binding subunit MmoC [Methylocystis heyeri]|uniref:2Fe-2S iron-sulfur cluster binding domain-containing protein n=1 Tax=Methylocystis heyeri TaxID=391905 RepID=A0A6B8KET1_9HYPH|nr:2Fe-2S iron-sulfur cluster binding domain-containing protein [Methylocystis heyeri]QGM46796.1 2Fe-2S iron-sulfur cluster binding domain-containing protein [Methylocystis heyeri]